MFPPVLEREDNEEGQEGQEWRKVASLNAQDERVAVGCPLDVEAGHDQCTASEKTQDQQERSPAVDLCAVLAAGSRFVDKEKRCREPDEGCGVDRQGAERRSDHGGNPSCEAIDQGPGADLIKCRYVRQNIVDLGGGVHAGPEFHQEAGGGPEPQEVEDEGRCHRDPLEEEAGSLRTETSGRNHEDQEEQDGVDDLELGQDHGRDRQDSHFCRTDLFDPGFVLCRFSIGQTEDPCQEKEADSRGETIRRHDDHFLKGHREGHDQEEDPFPEGSRPQGQDAQEEIGDGIAPSSSVKQGVDIIGKYVCDPDASRHGQVADRRVEGCIAVHHLLGLVPIQEDRGLFLYGCVRLCRGVGGICFYSVFAGLCPVLLVVVMSCGIFRVDVCLPGAGSAFFAGSRSPYRQFFFGREGGGGDEDNFFFHLFHRQLLRCRIRGFLFFLFYI